MIGTVAAFATVCVLGAWGRAGVAALLDRPPFPVGTLLVNCAGSAVAGALHVRLEGPMATVAVTGALGALTTFSSFSIQVAEDLRTGHGLRAAAYGVATIAGTVTAATVGAVLAT